MNTSSLYKKHIKNNKPKHKMMNTIQIKDISKLTPIPTSIKLPSLKTIQSNGVCAQVDYPIHINTDFETIGHTYSKIYICAYFVTTCKNRHGIDTPYLQYLLYKYPKTTAKVGNVLVFPFVNATKGCDVLTSANKLVNKIVKIKLQSQGYLEYNGNIYVFYNLSQTNVHSGKPLITKKTLQLENASATLWWVLIDEICNHRKCLSFPVHKSVTYLFYNNPALIYLTRGIEHIDIPIVAYYGNYYKFIPTVVSLGQNPTVWPSVKFGPFFNFTNYPGSFRYAGWTANYKERKVYNAQIADDDGKISKGGIARFALFMGDIKVLLDDTHSKVKNYIHKKDHSWALQYQSLYLGRVPRREGGVWHMNPHYVIKDYEQQVPLSMHLVKKSSLKATWDPLYTDYQIE